MDGCPITFLASPLLQLNPEVSSLTYVFQGGKVFCDIVFDAVMDTGVFPAFGSFELKVDDVSRAVNITSWTTPTMLRLGTAPASPASVSATIE